MQTKQHLKKWYYIQRFWWVVILFSSGFVLLIIRLSQLQFIEVENLNYEGDRRSLRAEITLSKRGMILDRLGKPLAVSVVASAIWSDPALINRQPIDWSDPRWLQLASLLGVPLTQIKQKITQYPHLRFNYLSRQMSQTEAQQVLDLKLVGIYQQHEWRRFYPMGEMAAPLIGVTDIDGNGIEGIEKSFDTFLTGTVERKLLRRARSGNLLSDSSLIPTDDAIHIQLTIDERLQTVSYREIRAAVIEHRADSGTLILVDIPTGEILALANYPSFNPNNRTTLTLSGLRNHAISDVFEPGSTVKPFVLIAALNKGVIQKHSLIDATPLKLTGYEVRDVTSSKLLSLSEILQKSSNRAISRIALRLTPEELLDTYQKFRFGTRTNLKLLGEQSGYFPKEKKRWAEIEQATFSFGYGQTVTPLQLAQAYTILGSLGRYRPLAILLHNSLVETEQLDIPSTIIRDVLLMMEKKVENGRSSGGAVPAYRVATKTGTAKKVGENGKYIDEYVAYIAGVAPLQQPRFALVIVIDNPKAGEFYGGEVAAPVFTKVMTAILRIMNIKPDDRDNN